MEHVALITGCGDKDGIGAALARDLVKRGWRVYASGRDYARTAFLADEGCEVLQLDITQPASIDAALEAIKTKSGRLDMLINNAAAITQAPILDSDPNAFRLIFETNVFGLFNMVQKFTPFMVRSASASSAGLRRRSVMVNIGSVQAAFGMPWQSAYSASKAAMQTMTDCLRKEIRPLGVDVINVELCTVVTPMNLSTKAWTNSLSSTPSGFYDWATLEPKIQKAAVANAKGGHSPARVAKEIVDSAITPNVPLKTWPGAMGWFFRYLYGMMPTSTVENMMIKDRCVTDVKMPVFQQ